MSRKCSVCNTSMYDSTTGITCVGLEIRLTGTSKEVERVKEMFGTLEFAVCYCCWLKSLEIKSV